MSTLTITRSSELMNKMRSIVIYIDGEKVGKIGDGETHTFPVTPGIHTVKAKVDWCGSRQMIFNVDEGEEAYFYLSGDKRLKYLAFITLFCMLGIMLDKYIGGGMFTNLALVVSGLYLIYTGYIFSLGRNTYLNLESGAHI